MDINSNINRKPFDMTEQLLVRIPRELAIRFRRSIPARKRSSYVAELLNQHLPDPDEALFQSALLAEEHDKKYPESEKDFEVADLDGLDPDETFDLAKLKALCQP